MSESRPTHRPAALDCIDPLLERGFLQIPVLIAQRFADELSRGALVFYGILLRYLWERREYPGHAIVADEWHVSVRSVCRWVTELRRTGLILTEQSHLGVPLKITVTPGPDQLRLPSAKVACNSATLAHDMCQSGISRTLDSVQTRKDETKGAADNEHAVLIRELADEFAPAERPESVAIYLAHFKTRRLERAVEITRRATIPANVTRIAYLYGVVKRLRDTDADDEEPTTPEKLDDEPLSDADRSAATEKLADVRADLERRGVVRPKVPGGGRVRAPGDG